MDQHPYYGAVLAVAIPISLYYSLRALAVAVELGVFVRNQSMARRARREFEREEAAWKALGKRVLNTPADQGPIQ